MKNRLVDLNDHLFAQIERLSDAGINTEKLQAEVSRTKALVRVSDQIIKGATLSLKAAQLRVAHGDYIKIEEMVPMIEGKKRLPDYKPPEKIKAIK
ncbi:MAG: hypothetical protein L3J58_11750 [Emcibacter sp.]|nr:hypothetical protein [Emcibacter sp.]